MKVNTMRVKKEAAVRVEKENQKWFLKKISLADPHIPFTSAPKYFQPFHCACEIYPCLLRKSTLSTKGTFFVPFCEW